MEGEVPDGRTGMHDQRVAVSLIGIGPLSRVRPKAAGWAGLRRGQETIAVLLLRLVQDVWTR